MINSILVGVVKAIGTKYPDPECWIDSIPQRLTPPCFYIEAIAPEESADFDRRFRLTVPVRVHYFPKSKDAPREECEAVAYQLYDALEFIDAQGLRRGRSARHRITDDGILMFDITYRAFYLRTTTDPEMQSLELGLAPQRDP